MRMIRPDELKSLRDRYPAGTRVELLQMDDVQAPPTNMFDVNMVQRLAYERDFYELVLFLEDHRKEYVNFILHGDE